jgi:Transposase DDE domain
MQHKPIQDALQTHFTLDARRLDFITRFITALFQIRCVQLSQIALALGGHAKLESNIKRARRFLDFDLAQELIARFVLSFVSDDELIICMDRTHWKFGVVNLNLLVIAIAHNGIALPIAWVNLEKAGNSNAAERKALLERVLNVIPARRIQGFAADREFIGEAWFTSLLEYGVNPVIRIKQDTVIQHRTRKAPAGAWFNALRHGEVFELGKARVMGIRVFVLGTLTADGELLVLVTVKRPSRALAIYAQRWEIETLFGALKTRGFNLEGSHITSKERSERLFGLLVIALVWAVRVGEVISSLSPLRLRNHGSPWRSVFRRGLDCVRQILLCGCSDGFVLDDIVPLLSRS